MLYINLSQLKRIQRVYWTTGACPYLFPKRCAVCRGAGGALYDVGVLMGWNMCDPRVSEQDSRRREEDIYRAKNIVFAAIYYLHSTEKT